MVNSMRDQALIDDWWCAVEEESEPERERRVKAWVDSEGTVGKKCQWGDGERRWYCRESDHENAEHQPLFKCGGGKSISWNHVPWVKGEIGESETMVLSDSTEDSPFRAWSEVLVAFHELDVARHEKFWNENDAALKLLPAVRAEQIDILFQDAIDMIQSGHSVGLHGGYRLAEINLPLLQKAYEGFTEVLNRATDVAAQVEQPSEKPEMPRLVRQKSSSLAGSQNRWHYTPVKTNKFVLNPLAKEWNPPVPEVIHCVSWTAPVIYAEPVYEAVVII